MGCLGTLGQLSPACETKTTIAGETLPSPGMMQVHYAPRTPAVRVDTLDDLASFAWPHRSALLVFGPAGVPDLPGSIRLVQHLDPQTAGRALYSSLHECDALNLDVIVIVMPPDQPEWQAIRDRLIRATKPITG